MRLIASICLAAALAVASFAQTTSVPPSAIRAEAPEPVNWSSTVAAALRWSGWCYRRSRRPPLKSG